MKVYIKFFTLPKIGSEIDSDHIMIGLRFNLAIINVMILERISRGSSSIMYTKAWSLIRVTGKIKLIIMGPILKNLRILYLKEYPSAEPLQNRFLDLVIQKLTWMSIFFDNTSNNANL